MKTILAAALLTMIAGSAMADTCAATSAAKNLTGAAKTSFMNKCLKDAQASCQTQAADKKLYGAAATSFVKKCSKDAAGQ
ncbi:PsiF family protein [Xanthobacter sp. VNH20]|uniref:PsiF family protein n=1 Tax=Xanthobacter sp. VNH20 TaxID=3156616 RepID=UPI0032B34B88